MLRLEVLCLLRPSCYLAFILYRCSINLVNVPVLFFQVRMGGVACLIAVLQPATANGPHEGPKARSHMAPPKAPSSTGQHPIAQPFDEPENQPLLAYMAHTLLGVAAGEAAAGAQGSRALRAAALKALRLLLERVGPDAAALAAILPGTASGLAQALQVASEHTRHLFTPLILQNICQLQLQSWLGGSTCTKVMRPIGKKCDYCMICFACPKISRRRSDPKW